MPNGTSKESPLVRYWQVIVVMVTIVFAGGSLKFQVDAIEEAVAENHEQIEEVKDHESDVKAEIAEIKTDQKHLKEDIGEIKDEQKEQGKKIDKILEKLNDSD